MAAQVKKNPQRSEIVEIKMTIKDATRGSDAQFTFSPQSIVGIPGGESYGTGLFMLKENAGYNNNVGSGDQLELSPEVPNEKIRSVMTRESRAENPDFKDVMERVTPQTLSDIWLADGTELKTAWDEPVRVASGAELVALDTKNGQYVFRFSVKLADASISDIATDLTASTWNKFDLPTTGSCSKKLESIYKLSNSLGTQLKKTGFGSSTKEEDNSSQKTDTENRGTDPTI
tara:strand:+ start:4815 stop:5507 length:693 start_codon:yes stop_codon:yes gene_type:complete